MSELVFIRHAQTDLAGTFSGHADAPVNDIGRAQIAVLVESLRNEEIDVIYTSDLRRAHATAEALAKDFSIPLVTSMSLREIHFGDWEGLTWTQIEQRDPCYARRWMDEFPRLAAPNGEDFRDFEQRVLAECDRIQQIHHDQRIAVVSHAGVMRVVLENICGLTAAQAWERTQRYCCSFRCDPKRSSVEAAG